MCTLQIVHEWRNELFALFNFHLLVIPMTRYSLNVFSSKKGMKTTDAVQSNISAQVFILNAISLCSFTHEQASISVTTDEDNAACLSVVVC